MTTLYVSPHLDDAVLSCAGGMRARGGRVVVASVFTRGRGSRSRVREDVRALRTLGAERVDLGLADAPARTGCAETFRALVLEARVETPIVREVERAIAALVHEIGPREVWLPLGIGGHVDHLTVFAARDAARAARVRFYLERPYAFVPAFVALRKLQLVGGRRSRPPRAAAIASQLVAGGCGAFVIAPQDLDDLAAQLARHHAGTGFRWRTQRSPTRSAATAIAAYASQLSWLGTLGRRFTAAPERFIASRDLMHRYRRPRPG